MADKLNLDDSDESVQSQKNITYTNLVLDDEAMTDHERVVHYGTEKLTVERLREVGLKFASEK